MFEYIKSIFQRRPRQQRPKCPFYGFHKTKDIMIDQGGNQCALIEASYSPCQMELREEIPTWERCTLNNETTSRSLEMRANKITVLLSEFSPKCKRPQEKMTLKKWQAYVMKTNE